MTSAPTQSPPTPDGARVAVSRERFLTSQPFEPDLVRSAILASWWRSRSWNVAPDRIQLPYTGDTDPDTPLSRSAMPVLRKLLEHLDGQPISVILTDPTGLVLTRMSADRQLDRHLDGVHLAPGFSYAEEHVGTNGIGTALEGGRPIQVFGHEHYAEHLEDLACAGVPIQHPISGKTVGAVDLTCWRRDADPLLMALARTAADQIRQAMLTDGSVREFELLQEYLKICGRTSGVVFALNDDVVMMNDDARTLLNPADQSVLLRHAATALAQSDSDAVLVDLPTGVQARLHCRRVGGPGWYAGGIAQVRLTMAGGRRTTAAAASGHPFLPGLVGSAGSWLHACHEVDSAYGTGEWLAVEGEPGVGKYAVLRAVYARHNPAGRFRVIDCADAASPDWLPTLFEELADGEGALLLRHVDLLGDRLRSAVSSALKAVRASRPSQDLWVATTLTRRPDGPGLDDLLRSFPRTVEVPPLRHHLDDLHALVPFFLGRGGEEGQLSCSPEAMQLLLRSTWPGNTEQLRQVLRSVRRHRRTGTVQPKDLPPQVRTVTRRVLSPLESLERDAIVEALMHCQGGKAKAAQSLGMSRATIYRKIHEYGIVVPAG